MSHYTLNKYISRLMAVLMVLALVIGAVPAALADGESGKLGDNLSWSLEAGTLTITGSGKMKNISETDRAPWHDLRNEIYQVVLPDGLTSIGDMAFYECGKLQSVVIPDSVTRIGRFAFAYCGDLKMLDLGAGVTTIEECAFSDCYGLASLQLPGSLKTIGKKAFYRCESIPAVTVPSSVTGLGISAFGYCKSLVSADIRAKITEVPTLLFYGCERLTSVKLPSSVKTLGYHAFLDCDRLNTVSYKDQNKTPEQIENDIGQKPPETGDGDKTTPDTTKPSTTIPDATKPTTTIPDTTTPDTTKPGTTTPDKTKPDTTTPKPTEPVVSEDFKVNPDKTITQEKTKVYTGENMTAAVTMLHTHPVDSLAGEITCSITITVEAKPGWAEATDVVKSALQEVEKTAAETGSKVNQPRITVYVKGSDVVDPDFVDSLAGKNVILSVIVQDGSTWNIKGTDLLKPEKKNVTYDLRYEVTPGSAELCQELGTERCYVVKFLASAQVNAEVLIRLDPALSLQNATFFQREKELTKIQSSVVDREGYAHFYLGSVTDKTEYYIAMNLPDVPAAEAIVPEALYDDYGKPDFVEPIKYEITGRTSSWGMNFKQVSLILAGVMVGVVVIVGVVMFALNKRKLKKGYIPQWEDDEEE